MASLNKVSLMGNLTRDSELKYLQSGTAVADIGIAINRKYTANGEKKEDVCFVDITFWGKQAEAVAKYLKKGSPIYVDGRLQLDRWEKDGKKYSKLKVIGESFQFIGSGENVVSTEAEEPVSSVGGDVPF